jgi:hypothetical protein
MMPSPVIPNNQRLYRCRFVRAGYVRAPGNQPSSLFIEPQAFRQAASAGLFDHKAVFIDHAGFGEYPSLHDLAGYTTDSIWNEGDQCVEGSIVIYNGARSVVVLLDELIAS